MGLFDDLWEGAKGIGKKTLSTVDAIAKADPQVIELVDRRLSQQDKWNDVFSTKLIELLDKSDAVRSEIRKKLDQIAAASQAQQDLILAAKEHRTLSSEYQNVNAALTSAQQKFARAEKILSDAEELKRRSIAYAEAEGHLAAARSAQEQASTALGDAQRTLNDAQRAVNDTVRRAETAAVGAEASRTDADRRFADAQQTLQEAKRALDVASEVQKQAAETYGEAQQVAQNASSAYSAAISGLNTAETALRDASKEASEAARKQNRASEDLKRAEELATDSTRALNRAAAEKRDAETSLKNAGRQARRSTAFALVSLVAAVSICTWGVVRSASLGQYSALAPAAATLLALCFGVYVWRKAR